MGHSATMVTINMISAFLGLLNLFLVAHVDINWIFFLDIILWFLFQKWPRQMMTQWKQE